ncbi:hypothetical protein Pcinc_017664 [Petrolisthes cinctipes]|uniref:Cx9C motif-containing protein 4 n=1 Tax=Petrolisthes cinctipes TaxID=88211 RepID=A0AAE1KMJ2_PETCI|nr:hypothetical protein Pcinc_017664 [Petrolisthes cinctipes]
MKKDPCQRQACDIQHCLQRNHYQEQACQAQVLALQECCRKWWKESGCCAGVKLDTDTTTSPTTTSTTTSTNSTTAPTSSATARH